MATPAKYQIGTFDIGKIWYLHLHQIWAVKILIESNLMILHLRRQKPFNKIGLKYHDLISVNTKLQQFHDFLYECIRNVVHNIYKKDWEKKAVNAIIFCL